MHICPLTTSTRFDLHIVLMVELPAPILPHHGETSVCIITFIEENIKKYIWAFLNIFFFNENV